MMEQVAAWWRARTARERLLLQAGALLVLVVALPLLVMQSASAYRARAAGDLAAAQDLLATVEKYAASRGPSAEGAPVSDGTPRGAAVATAQSLGLAVTRIEPAGAQRWRVQFESGDSRQMLRWIDRMTRAGVEVRATRMIRVGDGDSVRADFEIGAGT